MPFLWALLALSVLTGLSVLLAGKQPFFKKIARLLMMASFAVSAILLVIRGRAAHGLPLANGLDFALWLVLVFALASLVLHLRPHFRPAVVGLDVVTAGLVLWMLSLNLDVTPMAPALRSPWLGVHVMMAILSYSALCVSFVLAVILLVRGRTITDFSSHTDLQDLDYWSYRLVLAGLPLLTIMLITGSVWAEYAWGSYWSWDPKEVWALVTWLVYALYLHLRVSGWRYKKAAVLNIIGFAVVVFTFFGVSYLLPGLHSYLQT